MENLLEKLNYTKISKVMKERARSTFVELADRPNEQLREFVNYAAHDQGSYRKSKSQILNPV